MFAYIDINIKKNEEDDIKINEYEKKSIEISSNTSYIGDKYTKLTEMYFVPNVAMSISNTQSSKYPRTFLKLTEIMSFFDIKKYKTFIDIGADPGTFSIWMLSNGLTGTGISIPNERFEEGIRGDLFKQYYKKKSYKMIKKDIFDVKYDDPKIDKLEYDIIMCDIGRSGHNNGYWDSYNPGKKLSLYDILYKSKNNKDLEKWSDTEFHIKVLDKCLDWFYKKKSKILIVKMFNINDDGYQWNSKSKKVDKIKVNHKNRIYEYLSEVPDTDINIYAFKPESSISINNEYYLIFTKDIIQIDLYDNISKMSWFNFIYNILDNKIQNLESITDFVNNISLDVFKNSKYNRIVKLARMYLNEYKLNTSYELQVRNEPIRKKRKRFV